MKLNQLFDSPDRWTQEVSARDETGEPVPLDSPTAVSFFLSTWGSVQVLQIWNRKK